MTVPARWILAATGLVLVSGLAAGQPAPVAGDGPADIFTIEAEEIASLSGDELNDLHDDLARHAVTTGSIDADTAAAYARINTALIAGHGRKP